MKRMKVLGLTATLLVFALCISSCKKPNNGGVEPTVKKDVIFSLEQKFLKTKSAKSTTLKADAKYLIVTIENAAGVVYNTKRLDLYNFSGSYISEPLSLDVATLTYKLTKFLVLDASNTVIYATPLEGSALANFVDDPLPINFTVSNNLVSKVVPQVLSTEGIPARDFGYFAFDFDVEVTPIYFLTSVQIYNPATAGWIPTTANISITGTPGNVTLYNDSIAAITDTIRVKDGYTNYKISIWKTGYFTKDTTLTNAQFKTYANNPLIFFIDIGYGLLYNWYAATDSRNIAPTGWHVPTDAEWTTLSTYLGGESVAGGKLKEIGFLHWETPNTGATNETGFNASGSGKRLSDGSFADLTYNWYSWSSTSKNSTKSWIRNINYNQNSIGNESEGKEIGNSIRLIKDNSDWTAGDTMTDYDGNVYPTVKIGTQVWTAANWKCTHYRNGAAIPNVTDNAAWAALTTGAWCVYDNDMSNK